MNALQTYLLHLFFPLHCIGCNKGGTSLCAHCASLLPTTPSPKANIYCLLSYKNKKVRNLLHKLKYRGDTSVYDGLFPQHFVLLKTILSQHQKKFIIISIPVRKQSQKKRRCNHVQYIAQKISDSGIGEYVPKGLMWRQEITTQVNARNRQERIKLIQNTMHAGKEVFGKNVLLIDDIYTTGATIKEATRALKHSGAHTIITTVLAH